MPVSSIHSDLDRHPFGLERITIVRVVFEMRLEKLKRDEGEIDVRWFGPGGYDNAHT